MNLRARLFLLAILPLVGIMTLSFYLCILQYQQYRAASQVTKNIEAVRIITDLVHALQIERGQSAGHVASRGENFADTLPDMRARTNAVIAVLPPGTTDLQAALGEVTTLRNDVDQLRTTVPVLASKYTRIIRKAIKSSEEMLVGQSLGKITRLGSAVAALGEAKEASGLQRAAGATGLGAGSFSLSVYRSFVEQHAITQSYLATALTKFGNLMALPDFEADLEASGVPEVYSTVIATQPGTPISSFTAPEWFARSTTWIDSLRVHELAAMDRISEAARSHANSSALQFAIAVLVSAVIVALVFWTARVVIQAFDQGFKNLGQVFELLGKKQYDELDGMIEGQMEFGHLFTALNETKEHLRETDAQLRIASQDRDRVISKLDTALDAMAHGNLRHNITEAFPPDYESLRLSFNTAVERLSETITGVGGSALEVQSSSGKLRSSNEDLSRRTETQTASLVATTKALSHLSDIVATTASAAQDAHRVAEHLQAEATSGRNRIQDAIGAMQGISSAGDQMTRMAGMIEDIAFQTNLLALNAGVEAARAGEAGKGFAVVANEVRNLAVQSANATNEIKSLIESSTRTIKAGVDIVETAGEAFQSISGGVEKSSIAVAQIAQDTGSQASNIEEIKTAMLELDQVTQINASMVDQSLSLSQSLSAQAEKLSQLVMAFDFAKDQSIGEDTASELTRQVA